MSERTSLTYIQEQDVKARAESLAGGMRSLADRLGRVADQLEAEPLTTLLNSLGEVQSEGSTIDAGCGGYTAAKTALALMRRFEERSGP